MARTAPKPFRGWPELSTCSSWRAYILPFLCTAASCRIRTSALATSTQNSWNDSSKSESRSASQRLLRNVSRERNRMPFELPRLYAIVDSSLVPHSSSSDRVTEIAHFVSELVEGSATLIQYRNKGDNPAATLNEAREIRRTLLTAGKHVTLVMNDRADLCLAARFDG